ncbi:hypothetical protein CBR_g41115 [Chara braunii]|uniref:DNA mismatch repair proteins mutS family domain-containing protein n=1 Tax=Chara braunii TaxID=69332 RepID=A0A388LV62_CHABU|nr:hypothetical protein CBR_g41115 [Chara braunii]|eukprot:GBG86210.1 hypothetical protein CBR_g41115 [Chara braunii]
MACKVASRNDQSNSKVVEEVTFLYKLAKGACPKSYGLNVARLAGMPESVLERAAARATELEAKAKEVEERHAAVKSGEGGDSAVKELDVETKVLLQDLLSTFSRTLKVDGDGETEITAAANASDNAVYSLLRRAQVLVGKDDEL